MLLSRVADNLFWGARYLERAEDTARLVRTYTDMLIDLPSSAASSWEPLVAIAGSQAAYQAQHGGAGEVEIVRFLTADPLNLSSVVSSVAKARENLRTTREILPREAWQAVNDLYLYTGSNGEAAVDRRSRARFLNRVIDDCHQLEGVLLGILSRDEAYQVWRLGQAIERADMTTRVIGVRAADLLRQDHSGPLDTHDEVQWMGVLRSVSALQMYQRATRGPIEAHSAVMFLLFDRQFPRSVMHCVMRIREALENLPRTTLTLPALDALNHLLDDLPAEADDGAALDAAMDELQAALAEVSRAVTSAFVHTER